MALISRRNFVKSAAACAAMLQASELFASPLGLPAGLQLYSVRDVLPNDYEGTLRKLASIGYRQVEAAGFFGHSAADVKQAMARAGLDCVSAHYSMGQLQKQAEEIIQFGNGVGLRYIVCSSPMQPNPAKAKGKNWVQSIESMSREDWKWNADQLNQIGKKTKAAGIQMGYHNHFLEFHQHDGFMGYDILLHETDPHLVTMEMDCGWVVVGGQRPEHYFERYPTRYSMLHLKEFKLEGWKPGTEPVPTEMGRGSIDYTKIFAAAKKYNVPIRHIFIEQEGYPDMPEMQALKVDADWIESFPG